MSSNSSFHAPDSDDEDKKQPVVEDEDQKKRAHLALLDALQDARQGIAANTFHDDEEAEDEEEQVDLDEEIPLSPVEVVAASTAVPMTASTLPSASSNAPFLSRHSDLELNQKHDEHDDSRTRETDGSTSALRDVNLPLSKSKPASQDAVSISSETQRKLRPESVLMPLTSDPLILGIALVDFDHTVGPRIEFSTGDLLEHDEEIVKILPFLALPDGAHLNREDYSYFHLVPSQPSADAPSSPNSKTLRQTVFGISCNRQISASDLLVKGEQVTRSTVQKAVVILATKPVFGPIRDKLGVVTQALFNQRDFTEMDILVAFYSTLETSLRSQLTESGFYMGTSIRELLRAFRHRTLTLVKALLLQRKIVFYGHPVERLCTYQYSLVSLIPGLLQTLEDCGSPSLTERAPTLKKVEEVRTSDRKSLLAFLGMPLDLFGKDAFFQPYLPLQQIDMLSSQSCLCGATNSIVTQHKEIDMLVNIETSQIEYRTPHVERMVTLTPADRKWIDDLVNDVNVTWNESDPQRPLGMQFKGSDDYLRTKFEEYISAALASVKYHEYMAKGSQSVLNTGEPNTSWEDFGELFLTSFQTTNAHEVWDRITDPSIFDIIEPKHPCEQRPNIVSDLGLQLREGITDLHLDQQLAPARETITNVFSAGSTSLFKAFEGVRGGVNKMVSQRPSISDGPSPNPPPTQSHPPSSFSPAILSSTGTATSGEKKLRPLSLASVASVSSTNTTATNATASSNTEVAAARASAAISSWGSWMGTKASRLRESVSSIASTTPATSSSSTMTGTSSVQPEHRASVPIGNSATGNSASSALFGLARVGPGEGHRHDSVGADGGSLGVDVEPTPTSSTFSLGAGTVDNSPSPTPNKS